MTLEYEILKTLERIDEKMRLILETLEEFTDNMYDEKDEVEFNDSEEENNKDIKIEPR